MNKNSIIFDIYPEISSKSAVWPGDLKFSRKISMDMLNGDNLSLSSIHTTVHIGAHTDAPNHYKKGGPGISKRPLNYYLGLTQVIQVKTGKGKRIHPGDFKDEIIAPRVLFKTNSFPDPNKFNEDFNSFSPELIDYLNEKKVILVGIDTPSVDPFADKVLKSHNRIALYNMAILEGIILKNIKNGTYNLIALPLKIKDADASPVRAVLIKEDYN